MRTLIPLLASSLIAPSALADDTPAAPAPGAKAPDANTPDATAPDAEAKPADTSEAKPEDAPAPTPVVRPAPTTFSTIEVAAVPAPCASHARFANGLLKPIAVRSRLALAQCLVGPSLAPIESLLDSQESMLTLERAVARSLTLYDEVIALGDPARQIVAAHAKGQLYEDLLGRMAQAVPPPTGGEAGASLHASRKTLLDLMLQPWRDESARSFQQVVAIAKRNPALASKNPVVRDVVARAEQRVRAVVAAQTAADNAAGAGADATPDAARPAATPGAQLPAGATAAPAETAPIAPPPAPAKGKAPSTDGALSPSSS